MESDYQLSAYDYNLPPDRIAQNPAMPRDSAKLLVVKDDACQTHQHFWQLDQLLQPGDLLILNNTRVIPARLYGHKPQGPKIEVLLLNERASEQWLALVKPGRRLPIGAEIIFSPKDSCDPDLTLSAKVIDRDESSGGRILQFQVSSGEPLLSVLDRFGHQPLPPYITDSNAPDERYQTVYSQHPGSAAAPTAGLHFTPELLDRLKLRGIDQAYVTLHVGIGTFRSVEVEDITTHAMHGEWIDVPAVTIDKIKSTQAQGGRIIAVGTTAARSIEGAAAIDSELQPFCGMTNIFIYPGYQWRVIQGLITNFHLPKSSLLMLVSALIGRQRLLDLYQLAIEENYRFYSFGDAMLILPGSTLSTIASSADPHRSPD